MAPPIPGPAGGRLADFEMGKQLGSGHFSTVMFATRKADGLKCAIKVMKKPAQSMQLQLDAEIEIMRRIDHPTVVKLFDVFESEDKVYLVMELCAPLMSPVLLRPRPARRTLLVRLAGAAGRRADRAPTHPPLRAG